MKLARLLSLCLGSVFALACNPYNPDLGQSPFLCGTDEPRCPDGYVAVDVSATACECQQAGADLVDSVPVGDGAPFSCNDDPNEDGTGNDSIDSPTDTGVGGSTTTFSSDPLALCPAGDIDVFSLEADSGQQVTARLLFEDAQGALELELLNDDGSSLATGTAVVDGLEAAGIADATGRHLVRIQAAAGVQNNYTLSVEITDP